MVLQVSFAVAALVESSRRTFLCGKKRNGASFLSNQWHLLGGKVNIGETDEQAIIREIKEEASISIEIVKRLGTYDSEFGIVQWFLCRAITDTIKPGGDVKEVCWVSSEKIKEICSVSHNSWPKEVKLHLGINSRISMN